MRLALILCAALALPAEAQQQRPCTIRGAVLDRLADGYGESRQMMGLGANGGMVEMFANADTGTWTITITRPNGITCLIASGEAFEALAEVLPQGVPG